MTRLKSLMPLFALLCLASTAAGQTVLYNFHADWCQPCRAMEPTVDCLLRAGYCVERVDVDRNRPLAVRYGVENIPCFVMVREGREIDRAIGQTSYSRLEAMLQGAERPQPAEIDGASKAKGGGWKAESQASNPEPRVPHLAWRYERPIGHRAAVVRVFCQDDTRTRSIGSGTLVKWKGRLAILTARHVIQGAKKILVWFCTGKTQQVRVLSVDAAWDVAVLETDTAPEGVDPVEMEVGEGAMQQEGSRLESCGYGPDGKLACNSGLFVGYRRSTAAPRGPDDWMVISGRARGGDSGGPVFNHRGRMVGVLWGTDGKEVVCVQAGRLHVVLDEAIARSGENTKDTKQTAVALRAPTPPAESAVAVAWEHQQQSIGQIFGRKPIPAPAPQPNVIVQPDPEVRRTLSSIDAKIGVLIEKRQPAPQAEEAEKNKPSPLVAGLCVLAAIVAGFVIYFAAALKS